MILKQEITGAEPVSVERAARHLRLSSDDPGYQDVAAVVASARAHFERLCGASIINKRITIALDRFPTDVIDLPFGPVQDVVSIAYIDPNGDEQPVEDFVVVGDLIAPEERWPQTIQRIGAVEVVYDAGMMVGSPPEIEEPSAEAGILLALGDLWENREAVLAGMTTVAKNPTLDRLAALIRRNLGV